MGSKKAAIITPYGLFNYGNRLQNYAVDRTLKQQGFDVDTLILRPEYPGPVVLDFGLHILHTLKLRGEASKKYASFREFDRPIDKRRVLSRRQLQRYGSRYDLFVCGSDQIWNPHRSDLGGAEYGDFVSSGRKIAISPSFGVSELPEAAESRLPERLKGFHALSVRELAGQKIIKDAAGLDVPVLIDPTMSLGAEEWRSRASARMRPAKPYLFVYLLGKYDASVHDGIRSYAQQRSLEVVTIMRRDIPRYYAAGPQDFLGLIDAAEEVIADSFHAAVFSLLFETQFSLVERPGAQSMNSRFDTLSALFDLEIVPDEEQAWGRVRPKEASAFGRTLAEQRAAYDDFVTGAVAGL